MSDRLARLDRAVSRCKGCGDWSFNGKCTTCPHVHSYEMNLEEAA